MATRQRHCVQMTNASNILVVVIADVSFVNTPVGWLADWRVSRSTNTSVIHSNSAEGGEEDSLIE